MADERLELVIEKLGRLKLVVESEEDRETVVIAAAYVDRGFYSVNWKTSVPPQKLVDLTEETLSKCQRQYQQGEVKTLGGEMIAVSTPKAVDMLWRLAGLAHLDVPLSPKNEYRNGVIVYTAENPDGSGRRLTLPLQRPLSWERFGRLTGKNPISFVRMNTPVGDFCITDYYTQNLAFGFMSHLAQPELLAPLIEQTTKIEVSHDDATRLLNSVVALFATQEEKQA